MSCTCQIEVIALHTNLHLLGRYRITEETRYDLTDYLLIGIISTP
jgi:hypothetical protein